MQELKKGFLYTVDQVSISYEHTLCGHASLVIICPGFFNSMQNRWMRLIRKILLEKYDVIIFDFRGHGNSSGKFSWLARERRDLEAVLQYTKQFNYSSTGILAFSLGAAVSINTISHNSGVSAMILTSTPMSFWDINYHFWEPEMFSDLKDNFQCGWEGKGVRADNLFLRKPKPITEIKHIKDTAIMFIHGAKDWIIKDYHSRRLYDACPVPSGKKKFVLIEGGLHAERLIQQNRPEMEELIAGWLGANLKG